MSNRSVWMSSILFYLNTEGDKVNVKTARHLEEGQSFKHWKSFWNKIISTNLSIFKCEYWQRSGLEFLCFLDIIISINSLQTTLLCWNCCNTLPHRGLKPQIFISSQLRRLEIWDRCAWIFWASVWLASPPCICTWSSLCVNLCPGELFPMRPPVPLG